MKYLLVLSVFVLFALQVSVAQKANGILTHREVNIHYEDSTIHISVVLSDEKYKPKPLIDYYWYHNNAIKVNKGDYNGMLLDGDYQVTDKEGNLIGKGKFLKGVKLGEWKSWNKKGELLSIYTFKKGVKNGKYRKFENNKLIEQGQYKNDERYGNVYQYQEDGERSKTKYTKGEVATKSEKEKKPKKEKVEKKPKEKEKKEVKTEMPKNKSEEKKKSTKEKSKSKEKKVEKKSDD